MKARESLTFPRDGRTRQCLESASVRNWTDLGEGVSAAGGVMVVVLCGGGPAEGQRRLSGERRALLGDCTGAGPAPSPQPGPGAGGARGIVVRR